MGPAVLGLAVSQFVPGLVAGVLGWLALSARTARSVHQAA